MSKIIIAIHGLGNKPPFAVMEQWWLQSILDGFRACRFPSSWLNLELVYWAHFIHDQPLDPAEQDKKHPLFLEDPYTQTGNIQRGQGEPLQKKISDYLEKQLDKLLLNEDLTINFSTISDFLIHHFFHDLEIYYGSTTEDKEDPDYFARETIRNSLVERLRRHQNKEILLIGHSMGSIIAYDVLMQNEPDINIHTFVTCGSPLGIPVIMNKIRIEQNIPDSQKQLTVPENISNCWYNLSDLHDRVAINYNLADDYAPSSRGIGIKDIQVTNTYEINGKKNPHKSYGYLRTPEMADLLYGFLCQGRSRFRIWLMQQIETIFERRR